jgi:hypothetical protein
VGLVTGWVAREYMMTHQEGPKQIAYHPEFYDKDGDLIDEEIVSVRFEQGYFDDDFEVEYYILAVYYTAMQTGNRTIGDFIDWWIN